MQRLRFALFIAMAFSAAGAPRAAAQEARAEAAVRRVDSLWASAYASHDTVLALQVFDEGLVMTSTDGRRKSRSDELGDVRQAPGMTVAYFRTAEVSVRMLPGAAVVTGTLEWRVTVNGASSDSRRRYTATYAQGGPLGWRMVALHVGRAPQ